jgi:phosphoheptose isomerase
MSEILESLFTKYPELVICQNDIESAFVLLKKTFKKDGKLLVCGNGGSGSDSEHIVGELMKGFMSQRPLPLQEKELFSTVFPNEGDFLANNLQGALPSISLVSQTAFITAYANDVSSKMVFAQQVYGYGRCGDTLLALSTSGNSENVIRAIQVAKVKRLQTIALTGMGGGKLKELCDVTIRVPYDLTHKVQESHLPIYHTLCMMLEKEFFLDDNFGRD